MNATRVAHSEPVEALDAGQLATRCADETARYQRGLPSDDRFCFELFRRSMVERDPDCWEALLAQYRGLVLRWLSGPLANVWHLAAEDLVYDAFARFWQAMSGDRFRRFGDLKSVLRYLKLCAVSEALDALRRERVDLAGAAPSLAESGEERLIADAPDEAAIERLDRQGLWKLVAGRLRDRREQLVIQLSFVVGQSPAAIQRRFPDLFPEVAEVYRVKRNALERLRRSAELQAYFEET
jgi:RNA polymerase sigma factor (sigma-70 family)